MYYPIKITGKRRWQEGKQTYLECFCNGLRLVDAQEAGKPQEGFHFASTSEDRIKNSIKLMKVTGLTDVDSLNTKGLFMNIDLRKKFDECELPEWDEVPWEKLEETKENDQNACEMEKKE